MNFQKKIHDEKLPRKRTGFTLTEILVSIGILGILTSISMPTFFEEANKSRQKEAQSFVATIPTIISAYIDATGELPTQWDELSSIAAVMTNDGACNWRTHCTNHSSE